MRRCNRCSSGEIDEHEGRCLNCGQTQYREEDAKQQNMERKPVNYGTHDLDPTNLRYFPPDKY